MILIFLFGLFGCVEKSNVSGVKVDSEVWNDGESLVLVERMFFDGSCRVVVISFGSKEVKSSLSKKLDGYFIEEMRLVPSDDGILYFWGFEGMEGVSIVHEKSALSEVQIRQKVRQSKATGSVREK
ncbi:hypothetical protein [Roseibacillus ishigakijimensis]|uniref:hypothetical protein n=1 Tax=Roseibacillus ishigakijimensis TaxID=454146 RepID=UPI00364180B5